MTEDGMTNKATKARCGRRQRQRPGPASGFAMLPWLLLGLGSLSNLVRGETPNPWLGGAGLFVFNSFTSMWCSAPSTRWPGAAGAPGGRSPGWPC